MNRVRDVMTRGVRTLAPQDPIARAAQAMRELDVGVVPVCEGDRLVGLVTDRDIVVRAVARGGAVGERPLADVMSAAPRACFEDQPLDEVLEQMRDARVRRVPVLDHADHLVGMLSLGDVAVKADADGAGIVLEEGSEPGRFDARSGAAQATQPAPPGDADVPDPRADRGLDPRGDADVRADDPRRSDGGGREGRPAAARWADRGVVEAPDRRTLWVLVADEAIARFLRWPGDGSDLESVEEIADPSAHGREAEFEHDASGRRAGAAPQGSRQNTPHRLRGPASVTSSAGEDQQHQQAQLFAKQVARHLADAWRQKRFDALRIVAAPRFLGRLRKDLDPHVRAAVVDELDKDFVHLTNDELTRRLFAGDPGDRGSAAA